MAKMPDEMIVYIEPNYDELIKATEAILKTLKRLRKSKEVKDDT